MKKVLGIFCHPDDEVLAGWPIFQSNEFEKHLIICCDDSTRNRPGRQQALQEVCEQENINLVYCLAENNNFYILPTRRADYLLTDAVNNLNAWIGKAITSINPDYIFTHNPVGEYGHGSHRLLFEIISQNTKVKNLLITDISQESNHRSSLVVPSIVFDAYYRNHLWSVTMQQLDMDFFNRCKAVYDRHNAWSWSKKPIENCNLYLLKEEN